MNVVDVELLVTDNGRCPFIEWLDSLRDPSLSHAVDARIVRIRSGNYGDHKFIGQGVYELRIPKGPGLRVYYGISNNKVVILIGGGDKKSQQKDIKKAKVIWKNYENKKLSRRPS